MSTPILTTPVQVATKTCEHCGSILQRTGNPVTFGDIGGTTASMKMRGHPAFRGWVPSLLVAICPICDAAPDAATTTETKDDSLAAAPVESYLERVGREAGA